MLQGPRVVAIVGELEPTGMAKHVRVDREWHLGGLPEALDEPMESNGADWPASLGNEYVGVFGVIASLLTQSPHLVTPSRVHAGNPILDTVNVQAALGQLDLLPLQVADLRRPQAVAVGDQDHGRIPMPVAAMLSGAVHQALDLALGEIASLDCQVYDAWGAFLGCRFHADKLCLPVSYCIYYALSLHSTMRGEIRLPGRGNFGFRKLLTAWRQFPRSVAFSTQSRMAKHHNPPPEGRRYSPRFMRGRPASC